MTPTARIARIEALFEGPDWSREPGCGALLLDRGETAWRAEFGLAHLGEGRRIDRTTRFRICSITKPLFALVMAALEDEGLLSLQDPLDRHLPEAGSDNTPTLAQMLSMKSGLYETYALDWLAAGPEVRGIDARAALALQLKQTGRSFAPGARTLYCNANYLLLQLVAERATGMACDALLKRHVFDPAGMASTVLADGPAYALAHTAMAYARQGDSFRTGDPDTRFGAAGGVISTVDDLGRWLRWLQSGPQGWRRLVAAQWHNDGSESGYALGFGRQQLSGRTVIGHSGGIDAWQCDLVWALDDDVAAIILASRNDINWIERTREMLTLWLGLDPDPAMTPRLARPSAPVASWDQTYASEAEGFSCRIEGAAEELILESRRLPPSRDGRRRRALGVEPLELTPQGPITSPPPVIVRSEGNVAVRLVRAPMQSSLATRNLIGAYASPDLPQPLRIATDGEGRLRLAAGCPWPPAPRRFLRPVIGSLFRAYAPDGEPEDVHLSFEGADVGPALAVRVFTGRLLGLRLPRAADAADLAWFEAVEAGPQFLAWSGA